MSQKSVSYAILAADPAISAADFSAKFLAAFPNQTWENSILAWAWSPRRLELGIPKVSAAPILKAGRPPVVEKGFKVNLAAIKAEVKSELSA